MLKNEIYTTKICGYSSTGDGVTRIDNQVVFVKNALDKETVKIKILKVQKNCAWAKVEEIIYSSPERIIPKCKHFKQCGGCDLQHMTYTEEIKFKTQKINDAFKKFSNTNKQLDYFHKAEETERYRNKAIFPVSDNHIGLYKERSHNIVDIDDCLIQNKLTNKIFNVIKEWIQKYNIDNVSNIFIRTNTQNQAIICLVCKNQKLAHKNELIGTVQKNIPETVGIVMNVNKKNTNVILGKKYIIIWGKDYIIQNDFKVSIPSFFQVNHDQTKVLYNRALELAQPDGLEVADLYCGIGTISHVMAHQAKHVTGIEIVPQAIEDAKQNKPENIDFICGDASLIENADVVVVDPPRAGLNKETIENILKAKPTRIVYISCNPATMARDVALLAPYNLKTLEAVDMFPRTKHVECIGLMVQ
ncbi:MAG: 23S rRNA (uracil(1939)-C(5))-methyltransferase RlmD [Coriobacteriia bacterium]|nr:23S rRNA (uracil(1939)-C(5))-methyltransferase RlmD [Coriobacteriia bacterium]